MPSTVTDLLQATGLSPEGSVRWGDRVPTDRPGIYVVAIADSPDSLEPTLQSAPISSTAIEELLEVRPELRVDQARPTADDLKRRVAGFWLPDETVLYVGLAGTSLRNRVNQYYKTPLGARKPHAGGWFLKLLSNLQSLHVHFAETTDASGAENAALKTFCSNVTSSTKGGLLDAEHPFPFANLEWPRGVRKNHGITGAKEQQTPRSTTARSRPVGPYSGTPEGTPVRTRTSGVDIDAINSYLQDQLRERARSEVAAVEAAQWLDETGLLKDSQHRPGLPLRNLLRARKIVGQRQELNSRWFIDYVG